MDWSEVTKTLEEEGWSDPKTGSSKKSKNGITDFSPMLWKKTSAVRLNFTCACDVHFQSDMSVLNIYIYIYMYVRAY